MPTRRRCRPLPGALALAGLLAWVVALSAQPPGPDPLKRPDPPKAEAPKDGKPAVVKLPDGTFLWLGGTAEGERVTLTPQEFQKLLDRVDALKKELAARKPSPPSGCAIRGRVEKRGEQLVAALKLTYSFRTAQTHSAVLLGGRRAFLVAASLDGAKLPVLDTGDEGFAITVEKEGEHTVVLDVEAPVTARGAKAEVGFDLGLPRAPITTLSLDPPAADVKRVNLATRTPDPAQPAKAPESRRLIGVDVKQLAVRGADAGLPLGPVDSLEVTWDPPAAVAQPADQVQSAEFDVSVVLTEGFIESTAKAKLRGPARSWRLVAPATADVSVDRAAGASGEAGPAQQPVVTKPTEGAKLVWRIDLPAGSAAADWAVTAVVRQPRPKAGAKSAPMPVGPFAALDVLRQTGTVRVVAAPNTRFAFKHGPDLRRAEPPSPADEENSVAFFRLATGPTGATPVSAPLLTVEAHSVEGSVRVKPTYRLRLTEAGWHVRAEVAVKPIRTEVESLAIDVPAEWRGLESESDPEVVEGVTQGKGEGPWRPVTVRLAAGMKKPFEVVLVGTVPFAPGVREAAVPLPRFPRAVERDSLVTASVAEGLELRGSARGWDGDQPAAWGVPLAAAPGPDGRPPKVATAVAGRGELGLAQVTLHWQPHRPDVVAEVRADVTVGERQVVVSQVIKLRSPDGFPRAVRLRGPAEAVGVKSMPALDSPAAGAWSFTPPAGEKEATLRVSFALPLAAAQGDAPQSLNVGLLWPAEAARAEASVRVWVNSGSPRSVRASSAGWRELPPEPAPERDALPALTLAASAEHALVLETRAAAAGGAALRVDRVLIEAAPTGDGAVGYRARYRLQQYLNPVVEVVLPGAAGPNPAARIDGVLAPLVPVGDGEEGRHFRVTLPEGPPRAAVLELSYALPGPRQSFGETDYQPPALPGAAYAGPVRWHVAEAADAAAIVSGGRGRAEIRWRVRGLTYAPAAASRAALDRWFASGVEPGPGDAGGEGEPVVIRQASPEAVRVARVPWLALVIGCSVVAFLVLVSLTWLPAAPSAVAVAVLGGAFGVGAALYPQPASQVLAAAQPGAVLGVAAVGVLLLTRWQFRRRVTHLPGFTRTPVEPSEVVVASTASARPVASSSARGRSGSAGSNGAGASGPGSGSPGSGSSGSGSSGSGVPAATPSGT